MVFRVWFLYPELPSSKNLLEGKSRNSKPHHHLREYITTVDPNHVKAMGAIELDHLPNSLGDTTRVELFLHIRLRIAFQFGVFSEDLEIALISNLVF